MHRITPKTIHCTYFLEATDFGSPRMGWDFLEECPTLAEAEARLEALVAQEDENYREAVAQGEDWPVRQRYRIVKYSQEVVAIARTAPVATVRKSGGLWEADLGGGRTHQLRLWCTARLLADAAAHRKARGY
ncbi:hypothetical protein C1Y63_04910 [Corynebacterium sp. 13CS0277]|uniref:hypothetical protein n=1 Tax=Corynebacterium sp. 13CS0277 TaxID=2071994 RepID=UPI000D0462D9|nr:hypothetical protein [Corynebacterium sp. 13CS0277]PRQ11752.1 hypothetical protein C1Y63_04910 [Corynebacterium sp. 13CS0277]